MQLVMNDAVRRLIPKVGNCMHDIRKMIEEIPVVSEIQKQFFTTIVEYRYKKALLPVYEKIVGKEKGYSQ